MSTAAATLAAEEQEMFRDSLRGLFARTASAAHTRDLIEGRGGDPQGTWTAIDRMLGLRALPVPEDRGGQGFGWSGPGIAVEELGRTLYPVPYVAECVATRLLTRCDADAAGQILDSVVAGRTTVAAALGPPDRPGPVVAGRGAGWSVSGRTTPAVGVAEADVVLVAAEIDGEPHVLAVATADAEVTVVPTLDLTRPLATVDLDRTPARLLTDGCARRPIEDAYAFGGVALALEAAGGASRCLELAVEHVTGREQFGVVVGSLQAVKHLCADLVRELEPVRSAAYGALAHADAGSHEEFVEAASIAKLVADRMYPRVAVECIQLHGAMGFAWEHEVNLHYKRAVTNRALFGESGYHKMIISERVRQLAAGHG
ncbi:acyl-CoA dehydrogenase family protein [Pseudonocardia nigra]|uniref:acyl-CoA dehydrogenase family protein n=1 Tax=Pseudonocardia nigra TaxID=1921578 RepID=UPI001C5FB52D|nr:acyl-CoA dehydrogenase family protein [Pseudonocardia nigra]